MLVEIQFGLPDFKQRLLGSSEDPDLTDFLELPGADFAGEQDAK